MSKSASISLLTVPVMLVKSISSFLASVAALTALLALAASFRCGAQTQTVQVSGLVRDSSDAAVPDAQVKITNVDTSAVRAAITDSDGAYVFTNLATGPYKLEVLKTGFVTYEQTGIVLQVGTSPQVNVTLKVGAVSERIEVAANATMIDTNSAAVGQVIERQRVVDLPLNGRNPTQLIALSGAAVAYNSGSNPNGSGLASNLNYPTVAAYAVSGGQGNATNYSLDGGIHIDPRTNVGLPLPFPDALQEFKVETSSLPANYGSHPGGAVNAVTVAGTNAVHGDAFWFVRNGSLNARNFFAPKHDTLKRNQFGGVVGGPIVKDKVFFFAGYQGTTERTAPVTNIAYVPTAAVLQGNFQTILAPPCQKTQINLLPSSGAVGNMIPQSMLNPVALKLAALLPVSSDPCGKVLYGVPTSDDESQIVARTDWQVTPKDSVFVRSFVADYALAAYYDKTNILTSSTSPGLSDRVTSVIAGDTSVLSPSTVSLFRASFSRSAVRRVGAEGVPAMHDLGSNVYTPVPNYLGQVSISGYFSPNFPGGAIPGYAITNIFGISEDITMSLHAHQMAFGFNWTHTQLNGLGAFQMNPRMLFTGQLTGNALGDYMTGNLDTFLQGNGQVGADRQNAPALYLQDTWKVSSRLQLSMGLRWDPFIPQHQILNYATNFSTAGFFANQVSKVYVNAPPGLTFPGDAGFPGQSNVFPRYRNFAPRVGVAFSPRGAGTETIRAGYGIFYDSSYLWNTLHVPLNAPWGNTITLTAPPGGLSNPWQAYPGGNPFPTALNPPSTTQFPVDGTYVFEPPHARSTYMQQWNVAVQKQLGGNWLLSATYLGNKTTHQWLGHEINPAVYSPGVTTATQEARRVLILASPATGKYFGSMYMIDDGGNASYNGLLLSANHRFSHNFSLSANYTWSHCLNQGEANQDIVNNYQNPSNRKAEWGNCSSDTRNLFNLSLIGQSPKFGPAWVQRIASNWQLSGIFTAHSGGWLTVTDGTDISLTGLGSDRPNAVGSPQLSNPSTAQWFNTAAFSRQATGTFGNAGRSVVNGPFNWNLDSGLWRSFAVSERLKLTTRFEAFNCLNHARFNAPVVSLSSGTFGQVTSAQDPRILQVAMKLVF